ncbi:MAG: HD-GYP domain-containing protein [Sedimentibacter sp.]|uniref:HD-GYP domain-containing protein n=1 Tax=Sedimentibacter sp. TaxID=1960295 RepID=UPI003158B5E2
MLFITSKYLKPGMILAKDIFLYNNSNFNTLLLTRGQVLNNTFIDRMIYHEIDGAYIESDAFEDIKPDSCIDEVLKSKSLRRIKDVYNEFKVSSGKINTSEIRQLSSVVSDLVNELFYKEDLTYNIMDFKNFDSNTYQHCLNVAILSISTGISMGLTEHMLHELGMAGLLHDIGKMTVPLEILNKPGKLTEEEFALMKSHPTNAVNQLRNIVSFSVLSGIQSHHEKLDGTGYPHGLSGKNIHLYAKILAVCDVYDALTSDRSYRISAFPSEVVEYVMGCVDTHFDYDILTNFLKVIVAYPIGTFVRLSDKNIAVVVKNNPENIMRPVIRIINEDGTVGDDIDLLYDKSYMDITITDMAYDYDGNGLAGVLKSTIGMKIKTS